MTNQPEAESSLFTHAISATEILIKKINADELTEDEIKQAVSSLLNTKSRARGFFATYLTSDLFIADNPSQGIIDGLNISINLSSKLLVQNFAMSLAMVVHHTRSNNLNNAENSKRVVRRTRDLIQKVNSSQLQQELEKLRNTINRGNGKYQAFLERWGYDAEQKKAIKAAVSNIIK
ncbi:MAG: hypothetical protein AAGF83_16400 [Cyanobacteria bacterium P01_G01_bin.67]